MIIEGVTIEGVDCTKNDKKTKSSILLLEYYIKIINL
jgi:hypothetical protein